MEEPEIVTLDLLPEQFAELRSLFYEKIEAVMVEATGRENRTDYLPQLCQQIEALMAAGSHQLARIRAVYTALESVVLPPPPQS